MSTLDATRDAMRAELADAITDRDRERVEAAAVWLRSTGTPLVEIYEVLLHALVGQIPEYAHTPAEHLDRQVVQDIVQMLLNRLGVTPGRTPRGQVALVVSGPKRHLLGMPFVAHVLADAGYEPVSAEGLTPDDLDAVLSDLTDPVGAILGLNDPDALGHVRKVVAAVRSNHPGVRVLVAGTASASVPDLASAVGAHAEVPRMRDTLRVLDDAQNPLSPREIAVLAAVARGMSNPDAGQHLGVAAATVKTHLDRVYAKLGTSDRTATVALAMRRGWID